MKLRNKYFCLLFVFFLFIDLPVNAMVEPNKYKEKDVKIQADDFQDQTKTEKKRSLSEEQRSLSFEGETNKFYDEVNAIVFQSSEKENNTIIAKAQQVDLFSDKEKTYTSSQGTIQQNQTNSIFDFQLILIVLIALTVMAMFIFLIPKLKNIEPK